MRYRQRFDHYDPRSTDPNTEPARLAYCPYCGAAVAEPALHRLRCRRCGLRLFRNPDPGTAILVERDEALLLGRRAGGYGSGSWGLPGGFIEYDEDFLTGARREVLEETGLEVEIDAIVNVTSNFLTPQLHTLVVVLLANPTGGSQEPGDDLDRLSWFGREDPLPPMAFEADAHIIQAWHERSLVRIPVHRE